MKNRKLMFSVMISPECNLSCAHCFYADYDNKEKLHYETFKKIIDTVKVRAFKEALDIEFIVRGGELTMYPENIKYFEYLLESFKDIKSINTSIRLSTNMQGEMEFYNKFLQLIKKYNKSEGNDTTLDLTIQYSMHLPAGLKNLAQNLNSINNIFKETKDTQYAVLAGFGLEVNSKNEIILRDMLRDIDPEFDNFEIRSGTIDNVSHLYSSDTNFNAGKDDDDLFIYNLDYRGFCTNMKTGTNYNIANFKLRLN